METVFRILMLLISLLNGITLIAIEFFQFVPSPHAIAFAAFFGATMSGAVALSR